MGGLRIQKADVWGEPETRDKDKDDSCPSPFRESGPKFEKKKLLFSLPLLCYQRDGLRSLQSQPLGTLILSLSIHDY